MTIEIGDKARDTITGFKGVVLGITTWFNGCRRHGLQSQKLDKDGKPIPLEWFDEPQLELVEQAAAGPETAPTGGPRPDPVR